MRYIADVTIKARIYFEDEGDLELEDQADTALQGMLHVEGFELSFSKIDRVSPEKECNA